jgi:hypothetical protein
VYVDDLAIIPVDPIEIKDVSRNNYSYKLKGAGPITYNLEMEVYCHSNVFFQRSILGKLNLNLRRFCRKQSSFRTMTRQGHTDCEKHIINIHYLSKRKYTVFCFQD